MIIGNEAAQSLLRGFLSKKKSVFIHGIKGVGKQTSVSHALSDLNYLETRIQGSQDIVSIKEAIGNLDYRRDIHEYAVIDDAELLSEPAQDIFLKCLEEYQDGVSFILICSNPGVLSDALKSRFSHRLVFHPIPPEAFNVSVDSIPYVVSRGSFARFQYAKKIDWNTWENLIQGDFESNIVSSSLKSLIPSHPEPEYVDCLASYFGHISRRLYDARFSVLSSRLISTPAINIENHLISAMSIGVET